ncbi:MAG: hypothetical protein RL154_159 [Pseudomonadota bacterium]|jgi:HTH-type transcriptional regulator/antitoxin MqsA
MQTCPLCAGNTVNETRARKITYKEHSTIIKQPAAYCDECGEAFLAPNDSKATEKAIADFKREVEHLLTSDQIKQIRKKHHITQKEAAELFGGGINAFSKYERGEAIQSKSTDILLRLIDQQKIHLQDIRAIA